MRRHNTYYNPEDAKGLKGFLVIAQGILTIIWGWAKDFGQNVTYYIEDMHPRVRGISAIMFSIAILMVVGYVFAHALVSYAYQEETYYLEEAFQTPYDIDGRPLPPNAATAPEALPTKFGGYVLDTEDNANIDRMSLCANGEQTIPPEDKEPGDLNVCARRYLPTSTAWGRYAGNNRSLIVIVVNRFSSERMAELGILELMRYGRELGQVGNFSLSPDVGPVEYFMSRSTREWVTFSWSRGPWVFTVSGQSIRDVENVVESFPY